jgi:hypothetical protein
MIVASGCRKPLAPNIDRNEAPETWITAAPMDSLTVKDKNGQVVPGTPSITTIPIRFHLYWAGSDKDGAVAGFYYAVVETSVTSLEGLGPSPLPGPKPGSYHFTTRTDTTFVFTVSDLFTDREHAFFIYAVDNHGKPDPTPARFIFTALDKNPPRAVIDMAKATGEIITLTPDGTPISQQLEYFVSDTCRPTAAWISSGTDRSAPRGRPSWDTATSSTSPSSCRWTRPCVRSRTGPACPAPP